MSDPGQRIATPRGWLIPRDEEAAEEGDHVSSFKYAEKVTSFQIGDGRVDLGAIREELVCRPVVQDGVDTVDGPRYVSHPIRWYVFAGDGWRLEEHLTGRSPAGNHLELPSAGAPVDFLKALLGRQR